MKQLMLKQPAILLALAFFINLLVLAFFKHTPIIVDEFENYNQALNFSNGDFHLLKISAVPGYHALIALCFKTFGISSLLFARFITMALGTCCTCVFYQLCQRINPNDTLSRTIQFIFFPSIFIYYFVVYTDIPSLLLVLLMLRFAIDKRYSMAGIFGILSMCIRQNNIIWLLFVPAWCYIETFGWQFSIRNSIVILKKTWVFIIGLALFVVFVKLNHGIAVGDSESHPAFNFSSSNLFFLLFWFFVFFFPLHLNNYFKIINYLKSGKWPIMLSLTLLLLYIFTFKNNHPYNNIGTHYFIRNFILVRFSSSVVWKSLFFIPLIYTFWSLIVTPFNRSSFLLLYIFTALFLAPSWLIEQRYYIIPITLFMLFRKEQEKKVELITSIYYLVILCLLIPFIVNMQVFL